MVLNPDLVSDNDGIDMLQTNRNRMLLRPQSGRTSAERRDPAIGYWIRVASNHMFKYARDLLLEFIWNSWPKQFFNTQISHTFDNKCVQTAAEGDAD